MVGMVGGKKNVANSILQLFLSFFFSYLHQLMLLEKGREK